ncbi:hypothetical protein GJ496_003660 [Pomphorhynchus laevis]|nr:hypothetical protein GJ496_003660 [Pomphorhynchus laevis]
MTLGIAESDNSLNVTDANINILNVNKILELPRVELTSSIYCSHGSICFQPVKCCAVYCHLMFKQIVRYIQIKRIDKCIKNCVRSCSLCDK